MTSLDLGMIGNCSYAALIDTQARIVWCCLPRFDGDPIFNALINADAALRDEGQGVMAVDLEGFTHATQAYVERTAILKTTLHGSTGTIEVIDLAPRYVDRGRAFRPRSLVRTIRVVSGSPRVRLRLRPTFGYGTRSPKRTRGSNHIRYIDDEMTLRVTTDAAVDYVLGETWFNLTDPVHLILGPDEPLSTSAADMAREFTERTADYWLGWTRRLALPLEWQHEVMRAAITLKLCSYEETGAIIAAATTSIPESANSGRNWDYRFCWLRDAFFVVRALNNLAANRTMENYFGWMMNVVAQAPEGHVQPVLGIALERALIERQETQLAGYRGMGPVRVGNQAHEHLQYDVYGNVVLGAAQAFIDARMGRRAQGHDFERLELMGEQAFKLYDQPDAGMWELRSRARVHTSSALMCWAACDRLGKIAQAIDLPERARFWSGRATAMQTEILKRSWSDKRQAFVESFEGEAMDASVLLMAEVGLIDPLDPRFVATVERIEEVLADGPHVRRYEAADDFGTPETAFNICAFWRIDALARIGRTDEARDIFNALLQHRSQAGLMSEDTDPRTGEMWGNLPQTYSMVGIINSAMRLSKPWESVI
ncbi:MAG: glycoside hydrolase family 15 protein [Pseudomonadota bacterium]